jgi:hypothetical protein
MTHPPPLPCSSHELVTEPRPPRPGMESAPCAFVMDRLIDSAPSASSASSGVSQLRGRADLLRTRAVQSDPTVVDFHP